MLQGVNQPLGRIYISFCFVINAYSYLHLPKIIIIMRICSSLTCALRFVFEKTETFITKTQPKNKPPVVRKAIRAVHVRQRKAQISSRQTTETYSAEMKFEPSVAEHERLGQPLALPFMHTQGPPHIVHVINCQIMKKEKINKERKEKPKLSLCKLNITVKPKCTLHSTNRLRLSLLWTRIEYWTIISLQKKFWELEKDRFVRT